MSYNRHLFVLLGISCCVGIICYLSVYNISSIHIFPVTLDDIPHPSCTEYGQHIKRNDVKTPGQIMVGVRVTDRMGYTEFTASVIRKYHDISASDLHVYSTPAFGYSDSLLCKWYGDNVKITEAETEATVLKVMAEYFIQSKYKILFLIDSEMIFLPSWKEFITHNMITNSLQFLSLYHSATLHSYKHDCKNTEGDLCKGNISGMTGVAMNKDVAVMVVKEHTKLAHAKNWNESLTKFHYKGLYPSKSLIMRIGQTGQDEQFCGTNEVPYGFKLCELPCWIRNGIEFYFDLCTDPQEIYSAEFSIRQADIEKRAWTRPVIVYSFYGNKGRYVKGALENAKRLFTIYPGYKIWAYVDNSVAPDIIQSLCSDNVKLLNMTGTQIKNQMCWRFLIAAEPVRWFTILDVDYRMLKRGKEATDDWLKSGRKFHVMRDNPYHSKYPINGQMWGGYGGLIPNVKELIVNYNGVNRYMVDIYFLAAEIWPIISQSVWVHDAYSIHKFGEDHPFPTKRNGDEFVGAIDFSGN